ncbi:MAG: HAD family phosphatase [Candidatus Cloacimonetes bacterium]|nr:HAD family phosphatase [Candidatus Cloacimonadota bacterium]MBS3767441.1 HAD family phosphatase [Candidatus Cloacimonadota bacterium]
MKGILFDLDGVIVDTLHYHYLAWQEMFARKGGDVDELTVLLHEGRSSRELMPILIKETGVEIPEKEWDNFINIKRKFYRSIVNIKFYPNAVKTLRELRNKGYKLALVTASSKKNMQKALSENERSLFDIISTGDDILRGKPSPDPYEVTQKKLGLPKADCLVVENAPLGIESAKAAGIKCAAISTTLPKEHLQEADIILDDISDVIDLVEKNFN